MNKAILMGNLGGDPELRYSASGTAILKFRLATSGRRKVRDEWQDVTEWHNVVVWQKRAEALSRILSKGDRILVEGDIRTSSYEKDGERRYRTEIHAREVELCGGGRRERGEAPSGGGRDPF